MLIYQSAPGQIDCRAVEVPPCERDIDPAQGASIEALALFQMRLRDTVDFTVDFGKWLVTNGNARLSTAVFAIASDSPSTPVIAGQAFNQAGRCVVALSAGVGAKAGDAFYLDLTVTVGATTPAGANEVAIPARTLVRRIHVVLANG